MNIVTLTGRLTKDPELKYSASGVAIARFTLAVNRQFKQDGQPEADFINCIAFKNTAENLANYQKKGSLIGVEGRIQTGSYDGKDGKKVYTTDIAVNSVEFLGKKQDDQQPFQQNQYGQQQQQNQFLQQQQQQSQQNNTINLDAEKLPF